MRPTLRAKVAAWVVHLLTASGTLLGLLAMDAVSRQAWREALGLMCLSCFIDSIDGTLARWVGVKEAAPKIDGALLDNIVDYLNYALVPAYFFFHANLMPEGFKVWAAAIVLFTSCYQFCQADAKTNDFYFKGFPSLWNVVVLYLLTSQLNPVWNLVIVCVLGVMSFVPLKYIYPSRTKAFQDLTLVLTGVWGLMIFAIVAQLPHPPLWLVRLSWFYVVYYLGASAYLNLQGEEDLGRV